MNKFRKYFNKRRLLITVVIILVLSISSYIYFSNKKSSGVQKTQVTTTKASVGDVISSISASGTIETANYLAITTSVSGIVKKVYVKEGDRVVKGQNIMEVTLDSEGEKSRTSTLASYLKAKNSLAGARTSLYSLESSMIEKDEAFKTEKEENDYQSHDERISYKLAENAYIVAKENYESKKAEISQLEISLSGAWSDYQSQSPIVTAPSDGVISNIVAVEGTAISNSVSERSVFTVASIKKEGTPIATLNITEMDINNIKVGQKVYLTLNSVSGKTFTGSVVGIDKIGELASGVANYPVIVKFSESSDLVLPNMSVEGNIVTQEKSSVLLIPSNAITTKKKNRTVTLVSGGSKKEVPVETGISDGTYTEVVSGLKEGDVVEISALPTSGFDMSTKSSQGNTGFGILGGPMR